MGRFANYRRNPETLMYCSLMKQESVSVLMPHFYMNIIDLTVSKKAYKSGYTLNLRQNALLLYMLIISRLNSKSRKRT